MSKKHVSRSYDFLVLQNRLCRIILLACLLSGIPAAFCQQQTEQSLPRSNQRSVLFIVVDALRADALGVNGSKVPATPFLDKLATETWCFTNCRSSASLTKASMCSLWTSNYPSVHAVISRTDKLDDRFQTLPEIMKDCGLRTTLVSGNPWLSDEFGMSQGFDEESLINYAHDMGRDFDGNDLNETFLKWIDRQPNVPFFAHLHYMDCHDPYNATAEDMKQFVQVDGKDFSVNGPITSEMRSGDLAYMRQHYQAAVRSLDRIISRLFQELENRQLLSNTIIVLTADHGEEFGEHGGLGHGTTLYDELLRVPLMIHVPGEPPARLEGITSLVDVLPTLRELMGIPSSADDVGVDLTQYVKGQPLPERAIHARVQSLSDYSELYAAIWNDHKFIFNRSKGTKEFYDLRADPKERSPFRPEQSPLYAEGEKLVQTQMAVADRNPNASAPVTILPDTLNALKSIGYAK